MHEDSGESSERTQSSSKAECLIFFSFSIILLLFHSESKVMVSLVVKNLCKISLVMNYCKFRICSIHLEWELEIVNITVSKKKFSYLIFITVFDCIIFRCFRACMRSLANFVGDASKKTKTKNFLTDFFPLKIYIW